jgi:hypothetical protein
MNLPVTPLPFDPSFEKLEEDEAETIQELVATLRKISEKTFQDSGHALRSVHAKSHGIINGELTVLPGLAPELSQGLFARPGTYPVVMRLSTTPGDILDDNVSTPRALAMKVIGAEGPRLEGSEGEASQDFVLVNGPSFNSSSIKGFLRSLKLLAATTDQAESLKKGLSVALRGIESLVEKAGGKSPTLIAMGGHPETHILGETFYSQTPILFGSYVVKVLVAPISTAMVALQNAPLDMTDKPNALRDAVSEFFAAQGGEWELRVQFLTNLETMPIEDSSVVWDEKESPFIPVARISASPQPTYSEKTNDASDHGLSFSPWHGLAAHRPIGSIQRARKPAYEMSKHFRASKSPTVTVETPSESELSSLE